MDRVKCALFRRSHTVRGFVFLFACSFFLSLSLPLFPFLSFPCRMVRLAVARRYPAGIASRQRHGGFARSFPLRFTCPIGVASNRVGGSFICPVTPGDLNEMDISEPHPVVAPFFSLCLVRSVQYIGLSGTRLCFEED